MTEEKHHHSLHERLEAARVAADEVVADDAGQIGSETDATFVPLREAAAAIRAALHPDSEPRDAETETDGDDDAEPEEPPTAS